MKKIIALALALIMVLSMGTVAFAATNVTDEASLSSALESGGEIIFENDITVAGKVTFKENAIIDLNGKTLYLAVGDNNVAVGKEVTIKNGTINISNVNASGNAIIGVGHYNSTATLNLDNVTLTGDGYSSAYAVIYVYFDSTLNVKNSTFNLKNEKSAAGGVIKGDSGKDISNINIINSDMNLENVVRGFVDGTYKIENSEVTISGENTASTLDNGINGSINLTIDNSVVDISGAAGRSLTVSGGKVEIINSSEVNLGEGGEASLRFKQDSEIYIDETSNFKSEKVVLDSAVTKELNEMVESDNPDTVISTNGVESIAFGASSTNPGETYVVKTGIDRTVYKVKSYDFTTGTKGYRGASYIDEVKINKDNELVIVLKENYKLAEDKTIKGEIVLQRKDNKNVTEIIPVEYTVYNELEEVYGSKKADEATRVYGGDNTIILMDEDGGYVYFEEEMLKGTVKMNKEEKTYLNLIYGVDTKTEDTIDAIEELLGEEYLDEAIIEYYTFETRAFKNEVAFSYEAYEDDPHFFYLYNDGKLTKIDAKYDDDEEVEAWVWNAIAEGTIIVTDVEIVLADETTKNPDTGANDVVGIAAALAVTSLVAAAAISIKK